MEELRSWQECRGLEGVHVVEVRDDGFTLAHTGAERASDAPLTDCIVHRFLTELGEPPGAPGIYRVEPYGELFPLERY